MKAFALIVTLLGVLVLGFAIYSWVVDGQTSLGLVVGSVLLVVAGIFCLTRAAKSAET